MDCTCHDFNSSMFYNSPYGSQKIHLFTTFGFMHFTYCDIEFWRHRGLRDLSI